MFDIIGTSTSAGAGLLASFTVDWSSADVCNYSVFDPDPTTQTFAFSQIIDTASATYSVSVPNSEATTQGDPIACGSRTTTYVETTSAASLSYIVIAE